jgi:hypothetical protein
MQRRAFCMAKILMDDPMESILEAHVSMLEWNMQSRNFGMTADQLVKCWSPSSPLFPKKTVLPMAGNSKRPIVF